MTKERQSPTDNFLQDAVDKLYEMGGIQRRQRASDILASADNPSDARKTLDIELAKTRLLPGWECELEMILKIEIRELIFDLTMNANILKQWRKEAGDARMKEITMSSKALMAAKRAIIEDERGE